MTKQKIVSFVILKCLVKVPIKAANSGLVKKENGDIYYQVLTSFDYLYL